MQLSSIDHIVLSTHDVSRLLAFYSDVLGMERREDGKGKWSLYFGNNKINIQNVNTIPQIARRTTPGSGNFCLLTETPIEDVVAILERNNVPILLGPEQKVGATGLIMSVYFYDPDGNLVEVSNRI